MDVVLSLIDLLLIIWVFVIEGLFRVNDLFVGLYFLLFLLDVVGVCEFLFNVCILFEEFNQCDIGICEYYLDLMFVQFCKDVFDQCYWVEVWLLCGQVDLVYVGMMLDIMFFDFLLLLWCQQLIYCVFCVCVLCVVFVYEVQVFDVFIVVRVQFLIEYLGFFDVLVEKMCNEEYVWLDEQYVMYLDYVGGILLFESLFEQDLQVLKYVILGNLYSGLKVLQVVYQQVWEVIYVFFGCLLDEYEVIFIVNVSSVIWLVVELFFFQLGMQLLLIKDNYILVYGLCEYVRVKGVLVKYIFLDDDLLLYGDLMQCVLQWLGDGVLYLFVFFVQFNVIGV